MVLQGRASLLLVMRCQLLSAAVFGRLHNVRVQIQTGHFPMSLQESALAEREEKRQKREQSAGCAWQRSQPARVKQRVEWLQDAQPCMVRNRMASAFQRATSFSAAVSVSRQLALSHIARRQAARNGNGCEVRDSQLSLSRQSRQNQRARD